MPVATSNASLKLAIMAVTEAANDLGLRVDQPSAGTPTLVLIDRIDPSFRATVTVDRRSVVTADRFPPLDHRSDRNGTLLVVADVVTEDARASLRRAGVGFLDLRGHFSLRTPGLRIEASVARQDTPDTRSSGDVFAGRGAKAFALALLLDQSRPVGVRALARREGISASTAHAAAKALVDAALVRKNDEGGYEPLLPPLFWDLSEAWNVEWVALRELPPAVGQQSLIPGEAETPPLTLTGDVAAVQLGAELAIGPDQPADFYVADLADLRQLLAQCGRAASWDERALAVAVAPARVAIGSEEDGSRFKRVPPTVVALELARDEGRGRETLQRWSASDSDIARLTGLR